MPAIEEAAVLFVVLASVDDRLQDLLRCRAFLDHVGDRRSGEAHPVDRAHAADFVGVGGEEFFCDQLRQNVVVTLERGEDVGVRLECGEAVLGEIACAAAGFACLLDGPSGMPGVGGLESGGATFEFALLLRIRVRRCSGCRASRRRVRSVRTAERTSGRSTAADASGGRGSP